MSLVILFLKYIIHMNDKLFDFIAPESGALLKTSVQRSNPFQPNPPGFSVQNHSMVIWNRPRHALWMKVDENSCSLMLYFLSKPKTTWHLDPLRCLSTVCKHWPHLEFIYQTKYDTLSLQTCGFVGLCTMDSLIVVDNTGSLSASYESLGVNMF